MSQDAAVDAAVGGRGAATSLCSMTR